MRRNGPLHELSIAQSIVEIVEQNLPANGSPRVRSIRLKVGELAGVVVDSLEFCFAAITSGTRLDGATLDVDRIPLMVVCRTCHQTFHVEQFVFLCPTCGRGDVEVVSGRELQVSEIELAEESQEQV